jgi:hypothetical protein
MAHDPAEQGGAYSAAGFLLTTTPPEDLVSLVRGLS